MIGQLSGIILEAEPPQLLLDVNGVGYEIDAPMTTFAQLPSVGEKIILFTHFVVREDAQHLFGFCSREERALFRTLLKVNGIGPRLGITILSSVSPKEFVRCVLNQDTGSLVQIAGVGKKMAERLIVEMRDKLASWERSDESITSSNMTTKGVRQHVLQDAISALISLGIKPQEANRVINKMDDGQLASEELIRRALQERAL